MKANALFPFLVMMFLSLCARGEINLADKGKTKFVIVSQPEASTAETNAIKELADTLKQITGADFLIEKPSARIPRNAIIVGPGQVAEKLFPEIPFAQLGPEEIVIQTKGNRLLLAGGRPRGTLYAVSRFLQDQCGARWWTPWASRIPQKPTLGLTNLSVRAKPAFESRDPYWFPAFNRQWAVRNFSNSQSAQIPPEWGGCVRYKGFVHTFYALVPPEKHFAEHPEWFSLIQGKRTTERAQLCLTNPKLREFVLGQVKEWLRESPQASILSVSQNDWHGACQCADCKALDEAEGNHSGTMLDFVNWIAEKIEPEFPAVAIDTLAYQYTRKPPKTLRPRPNVIVRLCSIECNFREPLEHPSNASFAADIEGWSKIAQRLYIWDYTTDFGHYVQPHPNWFTLGPNLRFFQQHHVRGVFEEGAYQSYGSEMAELRSWLLAQLLWNPHQDDRALIDEFLQGYYGPKAAQEIRKYLDLMHEASRGHNLTCYSGTAAPFLQFKYLSQAEKLWQEAEKVADFPVRVRVGQLPVRYVWLSRWAKLREECAQSGLPWPLSASRKEVAEQWRAVAAGLPDAPWSKVTYLNEGQLTPEKFLAGFVEERQ